MHEGAEVCAVEPGAWRSTGLGFMVIKKSRIINILGCHRSRVFNEGDVAPKSDDLFVGVSMVSEFYLRQVYKKNSSKSYGFGITRVSH